MTYFSKKSYTEEYFASVMDELRNSKVSKIFSLDSPSWNHNSGFRYYRESSEVYIMLENEKCLVVDYRYIDCLNVELRYLTTEENNLYEELMIKDFFNTRNDIRSWDDRNKIKEIQICEMEYGCIESVVLRSVTDEYSKWIDGNIDYVLPTDETFDEIRFIMSNGKSFVICADDADACGDVLVWSEDANCSVKTC